jgi:hypothetical protein
MASGIFVNESGRILVALFFWIGKRVTILLPIFFYHKLAQSLLTMGFTRVVTPPGTTDAITFEAFIIRKLVLKLWKGACVVMDNCTIHTGEEVEKAIKKKGQN